MVKWTKVKIPSPSDTVYIIPVDGGSEVYFDGEKCFITNSTVNEILDAIRSIELTPPKLTKEDVDAALKERAKNDY